jgi:preprotein translocase subunit SecG
MLRGFILTVHIVLALMIVFLVLMQRGKGAEAGAGFGAGASGTVFGARGTATLFSKLTAVFAALFFTTSLLLAYMGTRTTAEPTSVIERAAQAAARARSETRPVQAPPTEARPAQTPPAQTTPSEPQPPAIAPAPPGNK